MREHVKGFGEKVKGHKRACKGIQVKILQSIMLQQLKI